MGAKNHGVIMPDANKEYTINQVLRLTGIQQKLGINRPGVAGAVLQIALLPGLEQQLVLISVSQYG